MKSIRLIWLFFFVCLLACVDDTSEIPGRKSGELEQAVLKLNVEKESTVQTRAATEEVKTIDFFIFNAKEDVVVHDHPTIELVGTEYNMTVNIPTGFGKHTLYLIANHRMNRGSIMTLDQLKTITVADPQKTPFVMATEKIEPTNLNVEAIKDALRKKNNNEKFSLKRNVAKFSIEVTAENFKLDYIEWKNCPTSAPVLLEGEYISPKKESMIITKAKIKDPVYVYQIQKMKPNAHEDFHVLVGGIYTAEDGTNTRGYYKLQLYTKEAGSKKLITSIGGNNHYKLNILSVSGKGANTPESAENNGFSNAMEVATILDFKSTHNYSEIFYQNGYQVGFSNTDWQIYSSDILQSHSLGYFYRVIHDSSLSNYTTFDPDYPNLERKIVTAKEGTKEISGMKKFFDTADKPVEMELCFTDSINKKGKSYTFTCIIQYGVLQRNLTIDRYPSMDNKAKVLPMLNMNYGEITNNSESTTGNTEWIGLAAQRHENVTTYPTLTTDNNIFIHIKENTTRKAREATIQLFGSKGYSQIFIRQEP